MYIKNMDGNVLYSVKDLADALGVPYTTIWSRMSRGTCLEPTVRKGRGQYYSAGDFERISEFYRSEAEVSARQSGQHDERAAQQGGCR